MDWCNERYVRLYTRNTPEWLCMEWQGRALWPLLLREVDRSGVLATKLGARGIAQAVGLPIEVVEVGIRELMADGCLIQHQLGYVVPNFVEAQESAQSDAQRKRESRLRRRMVTNGDSESHNVTNGHDQSQAVTDGHVRSQVVTPCLAEPNQTKEEAQPPVAPLALSASVRPSRRAKSKSGPTEQETATARAVLAKLGARNGTRYTNAPPHVELITARLREGYTELDLDAVAAHCAANWAGNPDMAQHLVPETLWGPKKIAKYADAARTRFRRQIERGEPIPGPTPSGGGQLRIATATSDDDVPWFHDLPAVQS
jgi:uncharacterized phage protein (TIGR02220 family)